MPRLFAVNYKDFPLAEVAIYLVLALVSCGVSTSLQAQAITTTTISEVRYSDQGWGVGYNGNLVGRFANESFALTRYARAQTYFLRSYDGSYPPKYSRYSASLHVDYPLT